MSHAVLKKHHQGSRSKAGRDSVRVQQKWNPSKNDLDALADHARESYEHRVATGQKGSWTRIV
jgi:hypothetical protein